MEGALVIRKEESNNDEDWSERFNGEQRKGNLAAEATTSTYKPIKITFPVKGVHERG